jgi:molecular chaperone GrpE
MEDKRDQAPDERAAPSVAAGALDPEEIQKQRDEYYDLLLRKTAEFDNYRKRIERDRQSAAESAAADLVADLLPIVDNLERALTSGTRTALADSYRHGVELIYRQLLDILNKRGVRTIDAVGAQFDPHYHEAVVYEPVEGARDGQIVEEFRRGYLLGDRLLRPAVVKVAKGQE